MSEVLRKGTKLPEELRLGLLNVAKHMESVQEVDEIFSGAYLRYKGAALKQHLKNIEAAKKEVAYHVEDPVIALAARINALDGIEQYLAKELEECNRLLELFETDQRKEVEANEKATA